MHYGTLVVFDHVPEDVDAEVAKLLQPYENQHWDWFQIGGRWTGSLDGYDPDTDPANVETCNICGGTGKRTDITVASGCNGCAGTGKHVAWPTSWKRHAGDIVPVSKITQENFDAHFHNVVCEGYGWFENERYVPWADGIKGKFQKLELPPLAWIKEKFAQGVAVVVDCHN